MNTLGEYDFRVRAYECAPDGAATLASVCNYLQEAATLNAGDLGFSRDDLRARGLDVAWVLVGLRVRLARYPRLGETVRVATCPRLGRRVVARRDFELFGPDGARFGAAASDWAVIDFATRRPVPVPAFVFAVANDERPPALGEAGPAKLRWEGAGARETLVLRARRGDLDVNGHVNNARYVEWLVETLPEAAARCMDFEIAFRSETLAGAEVHGSCVECAPGAWLARVATADGREHALARVACAS